MSTKTIQSEYYGDNPRWFIGIVEDIADPLRLGRVKVRIYGIHNGDTSEVPIFSLPWATVSIPTTEAGVDGIGVNPGIIRGSQVIGIFADGVQSQYPIVIGVIPFVQSDTPLVTSNGFANRRTTNPDGSYIPSDGFTPDTTGAIGNSNMERAFNFFVTYNNGTYFTPEQAAGIVGNLWVESRMNPGVTSSFANESSYGIAQWNPAAGRLQGLRAWAAERNLEIDQLNTQLSYIIVEMESNPTLYGLSALRTASTIEEATTVFMNKFERPNAQYAKLNERIQAAQDTYSLYFLGNS